MTVYVDDPVDYGELARATGLRWTHWVRLTADTHEELHAVAARLGLRRAWFQDHSTRWEFADGLARLLALETGKAP